MLSAKYFSGTLDFNLHLKENNQNGLLRFGVSCYDSYATVPSLHRGVADLFSKLQQVQCWMLEIIIGTNYNLQRVSLVILQCFCIYIILLACKLAVTQNYSSCL